MSWGGTKCVKPPITNVVVNKKACPVFCLQSLLIGNRHVGKSLPFSDPVQYLDRGTLRLWQNRVHRKIGVGQSRVVRSHPPARARALLLRSLARSFSGHVRARDPFSRRDSRDHRIDAMVSPSTRRRDSDPG